MLEAHPPVNWELTPRLRIAAAMLRAGEVVAYPTEAVWGLGCDPLNEQAVARILELKGRAMAKGLILIAASTGQLTPFVAALRPEERARLEEERAVPTTWLVPASRRAPDWLTGGRDSIAVRITRHPVAAALCRVFGGPVVSTSANPGGMAPAKTALRVRHYFRSEGLYILAGPLGGANRPSEIRDLRSGDIIRPGG